MTNATFVNEPTVDSATAKRAFSQSLPELEGMLAAQVVRPTIRLQDAAITALRAAKAMGEPEVAEAFAQVPESMLSPTMPEQLERRARALWYAHERQMAAAGGVTAAKVPPSVYESARQVRDRMLTVVSYHLPHHPELAEIRRGTGYADLMHDLGRLMELYETEEAELRDDTRLYRPTDLARASRAIEAMVAALTTVGQREYIYWTDMRARAYTALRQDYEAVRALATFLLRDTPEHLALFGALGSRPRLASPTARAYGDEPAEGTQGAQPEVDAA